MAEIINMPRLSDTMEEGTVSKWIKKVGDKIKEGDILAEIETDKATMEFESFNEGTLLHIAVEEGKTTQVDNLLAIIGDPKEDISSYLGDSSKSKNADDSTDKKEETVETSQTSDIPDGVDVIRMPRLSDTMEEGTVSKWIKKVGDKVKEGDILAEIETDKATMEFESFNEGTLLHIAVEEGKTTQVDNLLAIIGKEGTDIKNFLEEAKNNKIATPQQTSSESSIQEKKSVSESTPAKKSVSESSKIEPPKSSSISERIIASPLAKKIAKEKDIDLSRLKGSGESGRIIKKDIDNFTFSSPLVQTTVSGEIVTDEIPNSQMRKTIAKRLSESKYSAPHYYLTLELDMDRTMSFREELNNAQSVKVSFNDLVIRSCALALKKNPKVNSSWKEATTEIHRHINLGIAVAVEEGLVVPVLNFADGMSLFQIGTQVKALAAKARDKKLTPEQMSGSTFTISNLGMFGIDEFTSIINQPNSCILSVGAIIQKPVVKNAQITVGHTMKVTLACDHRTVDGATGAQFLQSLREYMESPVSLLI